MPKLTSVLMFYTVSIYLWSFPWTASCATVAVPEECKKYCERNRPSSVSEEEVFTINCGDIQDMSKHDKCVNICEKRKCPEKGVCKKGKDSTFFTIKCPEKSADEVEADESEASELGLHHEIILAMLVFLILLLGLYAYYVFQHRRDVELTTRLVIMSDVERQQRQQPTLQNYQNSSQLKRFGTDDRPRLPTAEKDKTAGTATVTVNEDDDQGDIEIFIKNVFRHD